MRSAIVPATAMILSPGKLNAGQLEVGDSIGAYDYARRRIATTKVTNIVRLEPLPKLLIQLTPSKLITLFAETVVLSQRGEQSIANAGRRYLGYCHINPKALTICEVDALIEQPVKIEAVQLFWEAPDYIWLEGILVGAAI